MNVQHLKIDYTNHNGERKVRTIEPFNIVFGSTEFHPEQQWLLRAWDVDRDCLRLFALADIHALGEKQIAALAALQLSAEKVAIPCKVVPLKPMPHAVGGIESALDDLHARIENGAEYPDVHWSVCVKHGVDADELQKEYDRRDTLVRS